MLEIVLRHAQQAGARRITHINLVIGDLTSIVDDSVQFYFDRTPATFRCRDCGNIFTSNERDFTCPHCGEMKVDVVAGNEFRVESIEVE
jgi:hydrogenase nickel incorporation protein HypA/HybF